MSFKNGLQFVPRVMAEFGPGDSIGIGLAALLSGVEKYYALDIIRFIDNKRNIEIFDELVALFKSRSYIPNDEEFPNVIPKHARYDFPKNILTDDILNNSLEQYRINKIRNELIDLDK